MTDPRKPGWKPPGWKPPPGKNGVQAGGIFNAGNTYSITHGAHSRYVDPLASLIIEERSQSPSWPAYLEDESYQDALMAWARAEARVIHYSRYVDNLTIEEQLSELWEEESQEEDDGQGMKARKVRGQRRSELEKVLGSWEDRAMRLRKELGLAPLARGQLSKDIAMARKMDLARYWAEEPEGEEKEAIRPELLKRNGLTSDFGNKGGVGHDFGDEEDDGENA